MSRMKFHVAVFMILAALFSQSSNATPCWQLLVSASNKVTSYLHDVIESKGARLFVRPPNSTDDSSYYGFVQFEPIDQSVRPWKSWLTLKPVSYWLGKKLTGDVDTRLTFSNGIWSNIVDRPTHWITRKFSPPTFRPTFLAKMPLILAWAFLTQAYIVEPVTNFAFDHKIESEIAKHQSEFDDLIQNDFRFRSIKEQVGNGEIDSSEAERSAYMISQAYAKYYEYRDSKQGTFSLEENIKLLNHYLFLHLKPVMTGDVPVPEGFVKTSAYNRTISTDQRESLFKQTHALYMKYQLAQVYALSLSGKASTIPDWLNPYLSEMRQDPFVATLTSLVLNLKISQQQIVAYLMENYFWSYRVSGWETLGLSKINPETGNPVVAADYQSEMLKEIQQRTSR